MATKKKNNYHVDFSIDNLSMREQHHIFEILLAELNYCQRQDLHITVTDSLGGKHQIWDNTGVDPDGFTCSDCKLIDCLDCVIYKRRKEMNNG